jgi:hypothetical protein
MNGLTKLVSLVMGVGAAAAACTIQVGEFCSTHCWQYRVEHGDIPDNETPNGYFDSTCVNIYGLGTMDAPIPALGVPGRGCISYPTQPDHETIKAVIAAKEGNDLGSLSQAQIDTYEDFIESVVDEIRKTCVDRLTCNETFCDIDSDTTGDQACTKASAESLCDTYVKSVAEAALDLQTGPDVPTYSTPGQEVVRNADLPCDYVAETGTGGGLDETGSFGGVDPFGDIETLVICDGTVCTVSQDLIDNVLDNLDVFASESVFLVFGSHVVGDGLLVTGLSSGDDSKELADAFGIQNNDVIAEINGVDLDDEEDLVDVVNQLLQMSYSGHVEILVKRRNSPDMNFEISLSEGQLCSPLSGPCSDGSDCCGGLICHQGVVCALPL